MGELHILFRICSISLPFRIANAFASHLRRSFTIYFWCSIPSRVRRVLGVRWHKSKTQGPGYHFFFFSDASQKVKEHKKINAVRWCSVFTAVHCSIRARNLEKIIAYTISNAIFRLHPRNERRVDGQLHSILPSASAVAAASWSKLQLCVDHITIHPSEHWQWKNYRQKSQYANRPGVWPFVIVIVVVVADECLVLIRMYDTVENKQEHKSSTSVGGRTRHNISFDYLSSISKAQRRAAQPICSERALCKWMRQT